MDRVTCPPVLPDTHKTTENVRMTKSDSKLIAFRDISSLQELSARDVQGNPSTAAKTLIQRALAVLSAELYSLNLDPQQAQGVVNALNGQPLTPVDIQELPRMVRDAERTFRAISTAGAAPRDLINLLEQTTPAQRWALVDAVERYVLLSPEQRSSPEDAMRSVDLIR